MKEIENLMVISLIMFLLGYAFFGPFIELLLK